MKNVEDMSHFEQFVLYRSLEQKITSLPVGVYTPDELQSSIDAGHTLIRDETGEVRSPTLEELFENTEIPFKNLCAQVPVTLIERVNSVVSRLSIPKRQFLEYAVAHSVQIAEETLSKVGAPDQEVDQ